MLKKMRRRFIGSAMAAFTAVVLVLLCFINLWDYHSTVAQLDSTLSRLSEHDQPPEKPEGPPIRSDGHLSPEVEYMIRFFSVHYDSEGNIGQIDQDYIASISREDAEAYATHALDGKKDSGFYNGYRYLVSRGGDGTTVIFLNAERELQSTRSLLFITISIAAVCLIVVLILVMLFSRRAIAPYMRNLEMQRQFITNAGHELKTPLTAISASADVLAMEYENDEWVNSIRDQTSRMAKLVSNLVTLSRLDEENPFPERCQFSLSDAIWETADPYGGIAAARGRTYTQQIEDGLSMTGDRSAVQLALSILLDNAIKYSPEGGSISLHAYRSGRRTIIEVSNTAPENCGDISRFFDHFYRADPSRSDVTRGTGIGLSIAKAAIDAHSGSILVKKNGEDITFTVRL